MTRQQSSTTLEGESISLCCGDTAGRLCCTTALPSYEGTGKSEGKPDPMRQGWRCVGECVNIDEWKDGRKERKKGLATALCLARACWTTWVWVRYGRRWRGDPSLASFEMGML